MTTKLLEQPKASTDAFIVSGGFRIIGYKGGKGGGSGGRAPVEQPDSLHSTAYANVLDLISEGEIYGPVHGLTDGLRDVYLDGTPIANADGSLNFEGVSLDFRSGTQAQDPIPGFPSSEVTAGVGVELRDNLPWTQAITNRELSAVRVSIAVSGLSRRDDSTGDLNGYRVEYAIDLSTDGGAFQTVVNTAFDGKTTQRYSRTHRIELPASTSGWTVRVRRLTPNSADSLIADATFIDAYTEVIDARFRYPMRALVGIKVNAAQFTSIPTRAYHMRGRIIRVPSNYDPESRAYSGTWDGTFKSAWTNNPAWIFYDIATNDRYGLGDVIPATWVDKWSLYQIGQYCDESIPNGQGGMEPRFSCNVYLQQRADAWKVLQDLASVFRGMSYYGAGTVVPVADMPKDPVYSYTAANVIDGKFNYVGSGRKTRYTVALVSWNDMTDMGRAKVEPVEDQAGIARYGLRQTETTAFGCTSQSQAQRLGRWILLTSRLETRSVSFSVGLDGAISNPGQVIRVADPGIAGRRIGGRVKAGTTNSIAFDAPAPVKAGDKLTVTLPSGTAETRTINSTVGAAGTVESVVITPAFSQAPQSEAVWVVDADDLATQTFRVVSVTEKDGIIFDINAVQHVPQKFTAVDYETRIQLPPITVVPPSVQPPPANVSIESYHVISQGIASHNAIIKWDKAESAIAYDIQWRRDNSEWVTMPRTGSTSIEIHGIYAGGYIARVRSVNALDVPSVWASSMLTQLDGILDPPPVVTHLTATGIVFGIRLDWGFPNAPSIIEKTELWYSLTNELDTAIKMADFAYPQNTHTLLNLAAGATMFFWARLVDKNGIMGDFYPIGPTGIFGQSSADASEYLDYFNGLITTDQLAQGVIQEIVDLAGEGIAEGIFNDIFGPLAGEDDEYAGDDVIFAGTKTVISNVADGDLALSQRIDAQVAKINSNTAAIQVESTTRATQYDAMAQQVTTVAAQTEINQAAVQQTTTALASLDGALEATYTMRAEVTSGGQVYAAGMALGVYAEPGQPVQSSFYVLADRFALLNLTNGVATTPFVVQGGQAFINQALIGTGWITNAMIGNVIQSNNYVANQSGWLLDKNGNFYNNGSNGLGRRVDTNTGTSLYYPSGQLAIYLGL